MSKVHNGVLIPEDMSNASTQELDTYASSVKQGNRAFIAAHNALEDAAMARGLTMQDLEA